MVMAKRYRKGLRMELSVVVSVGRSGSVFGWIVLMGSRLSSCYLKSMRVSSGIAFMRTRPGVWVILWLLV